MSTRGFIGVRKNGVTRITYNHSDSYPTWLGIRAGELTSADDIDELAEKIIGLTVVDETSNPTPEQLRDLMDRGFYQNVSTGADWYSALRNAQGSLRMYAEAGYIPELDFDGVITDAHSWLEWGYVIDVDKKVLDVYEFKSGVGQERRATLPFEALATDELRKAVMKAIQEADDED